MRTVCFDVDMQMDFVNPSGALYVPGAETIIPAVARLNRRAVENGWAVVSTVDAHSENDPEFAFWPPHCVAGTLGQRKPEATLVGQRILNKQTLDCFAHPELRPLLAELGAERYLVYGVVEEICVRYALFGLLESGRRVELVADATRALDPRAAEEMVEQFRARGGIVTRLAEVAPLSA